MMALYSTMNSRVQPSFSHTDLQLHKELQALHIFNTGKKALEVAIWLQGLTFF